MIEYVAAPANFFSKSRKAKTAKPKAAKPKAAKPKAKPVKPKAETAKPRIVPVNPKTGREEKRPSGKEVFYAVKDAKGKITRIPFEDAQKYSVKDLQGLNAALHAGDKNSFVFYEEMTKEVKRDAKGNIIYRTKAGRPLLDSKRKKIPLRKTKITFAKTKKEQKPVLFTGKKTRALDFGFQKRQKRERPQAKHIIPLATPKKKWSQEIVMLGDTLKEACNQIHIPMTLAEFKTHAKDGLSVVGRLKIESGGESTIVPFRTTVDVMANFSREVSQAMRYALGDHGLRFTSLLALEELALDNPDMEEEILTVGRTKRSADSLEPIFPEYEGAPTLKQTSKRAPRVSVVLSVEPL